MLNNKENELGLALKHRHPIKHSNLQMVTLSLISGVVITKMLATIPKTALAFSINKEYY
jgi:hypothetical protein